MLREVQTSNDIDYAFSEILSDYLGIDARFRIQAILKEIDPEFEGIRSNNLFAIDAIVSTSSIEFKEALERGVLGLTYRDEQALLDELEMRVGTLVDDTKLAFMKTLAIFKRTIKNVLEIPVSKELKALDWEEFFDEFRMATLCGDDVAVTFITPHQRIDATMVDDRVNSHSEIILAILKKIGRIVAASNGSCEIQADLSEVVEENDYVRIRHVVSPYGIEAFVSIPSSITPFQFENLKSLAEHFKRSNTIVRGGVVGYDPRCGQGDTGDVKYESEDFKSVLRYIEENDLIEDYELPYEEKAFEFGEAMDKTM